MACIPLTLKKNPNAKFIPEQTYLEAEEASRRGAFVIQADCIEPAKLFNIPIYLRNCFNLDCAGTRIGIPIPLENKLENLEESLTLEEQTVDHLMESLSENSIDENESVFDFTVDHFDIFNDALDLSQTCADSETGRHRSTSHAEDLSIFEIFV